MVQVFEFILEAEDLVIQLIDLLLCLADHIFFQVGIIGNYFVMPCLYLCTQVINDGFLCIDIFTELFEVLGTPDLLSFKKSYAATSKRIVTFYVFTMFFKHNKTVAVFKC